MRKKNNWLKSKIFEKFDWQRDFADAVKMDETLISAVLNGRRGLTDEQAVIWSECLGVGKDKLIERVNG